MCTPPPIRSSPTDGRTDSFSPSIFPSSRNLFILGDFNCHHPLWNSRGTSDPRREEVFDWVIFSDPDTPTLLHCSSGSRSSPDFYFAPSSLALFCSWEVLQDLGSDHLPILLSNPLSPVFCPNERPPFFNFQKARWDDFASYIDFHCPSAEEYSSLSLSSAAALFTSMTLNAAKSSIPFGRIKRPPKTWWSAEVESAVCKRRKAFAAAYRSDEDRQAYISASRRASSVIAKAKAEAWQTTCTSLSPRSNPKSVHSLLRSIASSPSSSSSSPNFPNCSSPRESAYVAYLRSHFSVSQPKALRRRARGYLSPFRMTLTNPGRALGRSCVLSISLKLSILSGIPSFSTNSFRLASLLALLLGLNLSFLIGVLLWFIKITKAAPFESVEMFRKDPFLALYFSLFINDLPASLPSSVSCSLYVDDLAIWSSSPSAPIAMEATQGALFRLERWSEYWCLPLNPSKCEASFFSVDPHLANLQPNLLLFGSRLRFNPTPTFLGVTFDRTLSLSKHVSSLKAKFFPRLKALR